MSNYWSKKYDELKKEEEKKKKKENEATSGTSNYWQGRMDELKSGTSSSSTVDIAPVKETEEKKKWYQGWFKSGAFEDGYQIGDVTKTILGTADDLETSLIGGVLDMGEAVLDAGAYLVGGAANLLGADKFADKTSSFIAKDLYDGKEVARKIYHSASLVDEEDSLLGDKTDNLIKSGGQLAATAGLQAVGVPWFVTMGATSFGGQTEEAFNEDATYLEAGGSGLISAGAEILTEKLFGGIKFGGKALDEVLLEPLVNKIANKVGRTLVNLGIDAVGEGAEEVISSVFSNLGTALYKEESIDELLTSEEAMDEYLQSFIGGMALGGGVGGVKAVNPIKTGRDYKTGLTENEQKVVDKEIENRIAEQERDGKKLTNKEKNAIEEAVKNDLKKGYISIDTIESALGGDTYNYYQGVVSNEDNILKEYEELGKKENATLAEKSRYAKLEQMVEDIKKDSKRNELKAQLSEEVQGMLSRDTKFGKQTDNYLTESYNERARSGEKFTSDLKGYNEKQKAIVQKAIDSGILNNTNRSHDFVDMVAKIGAAKNLSFDFANNAKLKESGFAVDGATINGFVNKDGVTVNIDSKKALNTVVGHEVTHVLEGTEFYTELQKAVTEYAKAKGDYQGRYDSLAKLYKSVENADIDAELTADLVGDYLFTDSDFINNLSTKHRNVFQKIYDEVKYLCKVATAGSKEARQLEKVKKAFEDAYRADSKGVGGTKYSVSDKNIKDVSTGYASGETYFTMSYTQDGETVGTLEYGEYDGQPNVKMIEVDPEHRRQGIATKLMQELQKKYPEAEIDFGMSTPDGTKLLDAITYDVTDDAVVADRQKLKDLQTELNELQEKLDVLYDTETLTEAQEAELHKLGDRWTEVYDSIRELEKNLRGKRATKTFVKTDSGVKYSLTEDTDGRELSTATQKRFANSKAVDDNGKLKVLYHGTATGEFSIFDKSKGNVEGDFGSGFYFTDSEFDVSEHYEDGGPDFENKVARRAEQIQNEEDIDYDEAEERARKELYKGGHKFEVYLNIENPAIVGKTILFDPDSYYSEYNQEDYDSEEDYEGDVEQLIADDIDGIVWDVENNVDVYSTDGLSDVLWNAITEGGIGIEELKSKINDLYLESSNGDFVGNEVARQVIESLGYDGIIDPTVSHKWNMDMEEGTTHYIVFKPNQIKAVTNQNPTDNPDIHRSLSAKGESPHTYGNYNIFGEDIAFKPEQTTAPVQDVAPVREDAKATTEENTAVGYKTEPTVSEMEQVAPIKAETAAENIAPQTTENAETESTLPKYAENEIASYKQDIAEERATAKNNRKPSISALKRLAVTKPKASEKSHGVLTSDGKQYMSINGFVFAELSNPDKSIVENEALAVDGIKKYFETANKTAKEGSYKIDPIDISLIRKHIPKDNRAVVVVGDNCYDVRFVDAVLKAIENPTITLSSFRGGFDLLLAKGGNGQALIAPINHKLNGNRNELRFVYKADKVGAEQTAPEFAPTTAEDATAAREASAPSLDNASVPNEVEAPYYEASTATKSDDPFTERDYKGVGNKKVKAYMSENPEVRPYFQQAAQAMLGDLQNSTRGERWYNDEVYYESSGEKGFSGTKRHTTDDIAYLLDKGYSYAEIEKGLNAIIQDHGAENIAVAKRIEFALNDRLRNGYTDVYGDQIPPNEEYLKLFSKKQAAEAVYNEAPMPTDADAPFDDIAPVKASKPVAPVAEKYEAIRPERPKRTLQEAPEPQPRMVRADKSDKGEMRSWAETSTESEALNGEIDIEELDQDLIHYQPISNRKTLEKANAKLGQLGYEKSVTYFEGRFAGADTKLEDIVLGERLVQEAVKRGDKATAMKLIQDISILGTELGQKVQALSIIQRLTPEGQLAMLNRIVERGKAKGDKTFEGVEVTEDMGNRILETRKADGTFDQNELNAVMEDVKQEIADQMGITVGEKINAWRYFAMLGNPKTHGRNIISNVAMYGTAAVKNAVARTAEDLFLPEANNNANDIAPVRTKTWRRSTEDVKAYAKQVTAEMEGVLSSDSKYSQSGDIKAKRRIYKNKALNYLYELNNKWLTKEDTKFKNPAFESSFREYLTANGIRTNADIQNNPEIVEKGKQYATEQALIATFQQESWLANKISEIENKNAAFGVAVGAVMPFKKTPINIAKTGLMYSPLGFAKSAYDAVQVKKGNMDASTLIDHLAQNVTGTALTIAGYLLAQAGVLNGAGDDDKEGSYDYQLGEQGYSLKIGDQTYSLSWLTPVSMPLFVGANAYEQLVEDKGWSGDVVMETLAQTLDPLSEMSFLSGLDNVLSSYDSGIEKFMGIGTSMVQNYATQFVPTLSSQVAAITDDTKRTTKVGADSDFRIVDETVNQLKYKIPGLRQTLEPVTDIWGNEVKQSDNLLARAFESAIAPYSRKENIATEIDEEIKSLYRETGKDGLIPTVPKNYLNYDNVKYEMSAKEHTAYKQTYGQTANKMLEALFNTSTYRNATAEERADMVDDVYDYARDEANRQYFTRYGVEYTNASEEGKEYYRENFIKGAIENDVTVEEYGFSYKNPDKYAFLKEIGVSYDEYAASEDSKDAYSWAFNNPDKYAVSKAVASDVVTYRKYASELYDIKADKDENGKSINGSRKEKVLDYINNLDADYGEKIILFKMEYNADDTYNYDIIEYLNEREDITREEMISILKELGFIVHSDGRVTW